jgi:uncharacterized linocin/CFP29 family protein
MAARGKPMTQTELLQAILQAVEDLFKKSVQHLKFVDVNGYEGVAAFHVLAAQMGVPSPEFQYLMHKNWSFLAVIAREMRVEGGRREGNRCKTLLWVFLTRMIFWCSDMSLKW